MITIPEHELEFSFARSSGPGGQNVNKVNSKAILRWDMVNSPSLSEQVRTRFIARFSSRLTSDGAVVVMSDKFRDQTKNRQDCIDKLHAMLAEVARPPKPRKKTKPSRSSREKNKQKKRRHSDKKRERRRVTY